ncbi:MAG: GAF domain-containing protein [Bernardetiaceae bacterium]|nr:GAF domain-containing protein [Bernardetiaceae bacterium]
MFGLGFYVISSIFRITDFNDLSYTIDRAQHQLSQARVAKEEFFGTASTDTLFLAHGQSQAHRRFRLAVDTLKRIGNTVKNNHFVQYYQYEGKLEVILQDLRQFEREFEQAVGLVKQKGFKNLGLEGQMRRAIHQIEQAPLANARLRLLTLRRHEKDFLLRKDPDYVRRFAAEAALFRGELASTAQASELLPQLDLYQASFAQIVAIEDQIGINSQAGLRLQMGQTFDRIQKRLEAINLRIKSASHEAAVWVSGTLFVLFFIMVVAAIWALYWVLYYVALPISHLREAVEKLALGDLSVGLEHVKATRLLRGMIRNLELIIGKFRLTMQQAQQIVTRQLKDELPPQSANDQITTTLNQLVLALRRSDQDDARRHWFAQGLAQLGDVMRTHTGQAQFYDQVTRALVKYLGCSQGALFVVEHPAQQEPWLAMKACYAYDRKKYLEKQILKAEGLVGAAWAENEPIYLTQVPPNYSPIASGLGQASPSSVLIMPLKTNELTVGVLELASLQKLEEHQIEFVREAGQAVASYIQANQNAERTQALLEKSGQLASQLQAQEEELRQNLEEMQATQEEMARNERSLKAQLAELMAEKRHVNGHANGHAHVRIPA